MRLVRRVAQRVGGDERDRRLSGGSSRRAGSGRPRRAPAGRRRSASRPARACRRARSGRREGISTPGGSNVIFGPVVSTVKRQLFVVREPGKPPVTLAWRRWAPSRSGAVEDDPAGRDVGAVGDVDAVELPVDAVEDARVAADRELERGEEGRADPGLPCAGRRRRGSAPRASRRARRWRRRARRGRRARREPEEAAPRLRASAGATAVAAARPARPASPAVGGGGRCSAVDEQEDAGRTPGVGSTRRRGRCPVAELLDLSQSMGKVCPAGIDGRSARESSSMLRPVTTSTIGPSLGSGGGGEPAGAFARIPSAARASTASSSVDAACAWRRRQRRPRTGSRRGRQAVGERRGAVARTAAGLPRVGHHGAAAATTPMRSVSGERRSALADAAEERAVPDRDDDGAEARRAGRRSRRRSPRSRRTARARRRPRRTAARARRVGQPELLGGVEVGALARGRRRGARVRRPSCGSPARGRRRPRSSPSCPAAQAVAAPWLPVEAVTTVRAGARTPRAPAARRAT